MKSNLRPVHTVEDDEYEAEATQPAYVKRTHEQGEAGEEETQEACLEVTIGQSSSDTQIVAIPTPVDFCLSTPLNPGFITDYGTWTTSHQNLNFDIKVSGLYVTVTAETRWYAAGWDLDLRFQCCNHTQVRYIGCFKDDEQRAFKGGPKKYGYTKSSCSEACIDYELFALQHSGWCQCDNHPPLSPTYPQLVGETCGTLCDGDACGGNWKNAVYSNIDGKRGPVGYSKYTTGGCVGLNELGKSEQNNVQACAALCNVEPACVSFEYGKFNTRCQLSSSCRYEDTVDDTYDHYNYFEKIGAL